jgi:hypothetical protein
MNILRLLFGGWNSLAKLYPDQETQIDRTYSESSLYFAGSLLGSYRKCISVSVGPTGLRIRVPVVSSLLQLTPIVLAWSDIERCDSARLGLCNDAVKLYIRGWSHPVYLCSFLGKYGDVRDDLQRRWNTGHRSWTPSVPFSHLASSLADSPEAKNAPNS